MFYIRVGDFYLLGDFYFLLKGKFIHPKNIVESLLKTFLLGFSHHLYAFCSGIGNDHREGTPFGVVLRIDMPLRSYLPLENKQILCIGEFLLGESPYHWVFLLMPASKRRLKVDLCTCESYTEQGYKNGENIFLHILNLFKS